jgi:hypothetical protein
MTTRHNANAPEIPQTIRADKLRYGIFGSKGRHEVWLMRSMSPLHWTLINRFTNRVDAQEAVARYVATRKIAQEMACRS